MKNIFFLSLPTDSSNKNPLPIDQEIWDKFTADVNELIHPETLPHNFILKGHKNNGRPLVDSNVISFSPDDENKGSDLVIKRNGDKIFLRIKTNDGQYAMIVGAILLAFRNHIKKAIVSNKLHFDGILQSISYYQYVMERNAPIIHPSMANKVSITFNWLDNVLPEDAEQTLEDIKAILGGNAINIDIKLHEK
jgi:hypothetical protein